MRLKKTNPAINSSPPTPPVFMVDSNPFINDVLRSRSAVVWNAGVGLRGVSPGVVIVIYSVKKHFCK